MIWKLMQHKNNENVVYWMRKVVLESGNEAELRCPVNAAGNGSEEEGEELPPPSRSAYGPNFPARFVNATYKKIGEIDE